MIRILSEIIEQLRALGYDVTAKIGSRWLTSQNSDIDGIVFLFDPLQYQGSDIVENHRLKYLVGSPTLQDAESTADSVVVIEACELVNRKFYQLLRAYQNEAEQQVLTVGELITVQQYFDFTFLEICTSGIMCELPVTRQITNVC